MFQNRFCLFVVILFAHYAKYSTSDEYVNEIYFAHPDRCELFYQCSNRVCFEKSCPGGLYFNVTVNVCDYPENVKCEPTPSTSQPTEPADISTTTEKKADDLCQSECLSYFGTELATLVSRVQKLETKATDLESKSVELETTSTQLNIRSLELKVKSDRLEDNFTELADLVNNIKNNSITNLRLGDLQTFNVWNALGVEDTYGWVITGAGNFNQDQFLDYVHRRRIEKFVNGQWAGL